MKLVLNKNIVSMKRKYLYYSKYKINGLECHEFDEIIIQINHE